MHGRWGEQQGRVKELQGRVRELQGGMQGIEGRIGGMEEDHEQFSSLTQSALYPLLVFNFFF